MIYEALRKELRAKRHRMTAQREIVLRVFVKWQKSIRSAKRLFTGA